MYELVITNEDPQEICLNNPQIFPLDYSNLNE